MALITRASKGAALTHSEMDGNFTYLTSSMVHSGSISGNTLTLHKSGSQYDIDLSGLSGGSSTPTGSFLTSGSFDENLSEITLYSEDGDYTLDLSSLGGISLGALSVTEGAASESGSLSYNNGTGVFTFNPADLSGLGGGASVDTGSFYVSSSVVNNTITFTQGDGTTESVTVNTGSAAAVDYTIQQATQFAPNNNVQSATNFNLVVGSLSVTAGQTLATTNPLSRLAGKVFGTDAFVTATVFDGDSTSRSTDVEALSASGEISFRLSTGASETTLIMYHIFVLV